MITQVLRALAVFATVAALALGMAAGVASASARQPSGGQRPARPAPHKLRPRPRGRVPHLGSGNLINHGGPVQAAPRVYVDFWDWTSDPSGEQAYLERFLSSVGSTSWLATVGQYGGGSAGDLLAGAWS